LIGPATMMLQPSVAFQAAPIPMSPPTINVEPTTVITMPAPTMEALRCTSGPS
jgi:hypothetical protein